MTQCSDGKYYDRQVEEAAAAFSAGRADNAELAPCPSCGVSALVDKDAPRFSCSNPKCLQESCRKCGRRWKTHTTGKTCEDLEAEETRARLRFEERMTEALVRTCPSCGAGLIKSGGCNLMTCHCGSPMCYVCREAVQNHFAHFCKCEAGAPSSSSGEEELSLYTVCVQCQKCLRNSDPAADDDRILQEILKEAEEGELNSGAL